MKKKDVVYLALAGVIFMAAGFLASTKLAPSGGQAGKQVSVEVVEPISPNYDRAALEQLADKDRARDFSVTNDLNSGLGNKAPFGPF
ncbi:hypothetical protein KY386_01825 [Candidatus Parcubacteria bacterium]|nr:hypothetical protein [Candidatus Parcubacteria bacterium]